jgi:proline dehydrogenase
MFRVMRKILLWLSRNRKAQGMIAALPVSRRVARRFVAGERLEEALAVMQKLNASGLAGSLDHLGEMVSTEAEAAAATDAYIEILDVLKERGLRCGVSVKLTDLGLGLGVDKARANAHRIVARAARLDRFVRIDMESSDAVDRTLAIYRDLRREFDNVGTVLQVYLHRTARDLGELIQEGIADLRLVKGAYDEPPEIAYRGRERIRKAYRDALRTIWDAGARSRGARVAVATHDADLVEYARALAREREISPGDFEFQFLYGIRRELAERLRAEGYGVRLYVPFGSRWYSYFMRRLAERPANLWFFLRALVGD